MRALGLLCGIGTMLHEARAAGFDICGNVDTRTAFKSVPWIWPMNFEQPLYTDAERAKTEAPDYWYDADLVLSHPPCGAYSNLACSGKSIDKYPDAAQRMEMHHAHRQRVGLIPLFTELVNHFHPRVFALDNLPKAMSTFPEQWWQDAMPDYHLAFLIITNWDYGSCQVRKRLWVIGARDRRFHFRAPASRIDGPTSGWEAMSDLAWQPWMNFPETAHVHSAVTHFPSGGYWLGTGNSRRRAELRTEEAMGFLQLPHGFLWPYETDTGRPTKKPNHARVYFDRPSRTPTRTETLHHPLTGWLLTPRERARLQGWPDDFKLGDVTTDYNHYTLSRLCQVTALAVPSEFPRYLIPQLRKFLRRTHHAHL